MSVSFNAPAIAQFLRQNQFTGACVFSFNGTHLVVGGNCSTPVLISVESKTVEMLSEKVTRGKEDVIKAIAISDESSVAAAGYIDGGVVVWDIARRVAGARYKLIHKDPISHIAFLANNSKIVVVDESGVITFLSLVQSCLCELVLQTTVINLKTPVIGFTSYFPDLVGFASQAGYSLFRAGRRTEVLVNMEPFEEKNLSCGLDVKDGFTRAIVCWGKQAIVYEVTPDKVKSLIVEINFLPEKVICGFIVDFDYYLLVLDKGVVQIFDSNAEMLKEITGMPVNVPVHNIKFIDGTLLFFSPDLILQQEIKIGRRSETEVAEA